MTSNNNLNTIKLQNLDPTSIENLLSDEHERLERMFRG